MSGDICKLSDRFLTSLDELDISAITMKCVRFNLTKLSIILSQNCVLTARIIPAVVLPFVSTSISCSIVSQVVKRAQFLYNKVLLSTGFSKQQFRSLDPDSSYSVGRPLETLAPSCIKLAFVPRQKFYIVKFVDRKVWILVFFSFGLSIFLHCILMMKCRSI